jgi:hypothetical protein
MSAAPLVPRSLAAADAEESNVLEQFPAMKRSRVNQCRRRAE